MIYLFRIISDENPDFYRDLVAKGSDTFLDFHNTLQKELGYDASQLASFFITNERWEKEQEITLINMMQEPGLTSYTMDQVTLEEHLGELNQRMLYLFDFFSDRAFYIELIEMEDEISPRQTPFIGHRQEDPPQQLSLDPLMDESPELEDPDPMHDPEPMDDSDNLRIDDLDPDIFDAGMPEDF
jgi:hypothetical protein